MIASCSGEDALDACMARLGKVCLRLGAEIIVVRAAPDSELAELAKRYPSARIVSAPVDLSPHDLRSLGLLESTGDIVAFTDAEEERGEEWLAVLERRARNDGDYGPTPNGNSDWARYLSERGLLFRNER